MGTHGSGSVVPTKNGRYIVAVTMADGRRKYRRAASEADAERIRQSLIEERETDLDPSRLTLAAFLRSWLASLRDARTQRVRPRTLDHYTLIVERHIIPALGGRKMSALSERHVQQWLDGDIGAARTVHHHRAVLRRALNVALRQRLVARNVALGVELPDPRGFEGSPLTLDEARALLTVPGRLAPLWRLALDTGLRQGELLGLGWDDLDLEAGTVTVTAQLQRLGGSWLRTPTKAARSLDRLELDPRTVEALRRRRLEHGNERLATWRYPGLVFSRPDGEPYHGAEILRAFKAACREAGITERRFHDIRGTVATLMRDLGIAEETRMARLGHASIAMSRHYAKASGTEDRKAARLLGEALGRVRRAPKAEVSK